MGRSKGEGTVFKLPSGRWRARVRYKGRSASADRPTKRQAAAELPRLKMKVGRPQLGNLTVAAWLPLWLDEAGYEGETLRLYARMVDAHLVPALGHLDLGEITPPLLKATWADLDARGIGRPTLARAHSVLSAALKEAASRGMILTVPTDLAKPPTYTPAKPRPLTPAEARRLLAACRQPDVPSGRILGTILLTGLRVSEAIALRWRHIDVDRALVDVPGTKTAASAATLPLSPQALELIGPPGAPEAPVFTGRYRGRPTSRQTVHAHLHELCDTLGIDRRRVHDLRHTFGSVGASAGVEQRVMQAGLRHADPAMTVLYTQAHATALRDAVNRIGAELL